MEFIRKILDGITARLGGDRSLENDFPIKRCCLGDVDHRYSWR